MSNIHILEKDQMNKSVNCVFHVPVPDTNNAVGTNWRDVIQRALKPEAYMPWNDSTENANIVAGNILEAIETVRFTSINLTNAERLEQVQIAYDIRKTQLITELADKLDFFGKVL